MGWPPRWLRGSECECSAACSRVRGSSLRLARPLVAGLALPPVVTALVVVVGLRLVLVSLASSPVRRGFGCTGFLCLTGGIAPSPQAWVNVTSFSSLPLSRSLSRRTPPPSQGIRCGRCGPAGKKVVGEDLPPSLLKGAMEEALAVARSPPKR